MKVYIETCEENINLPEYSNYGDAGMDVRASENTVLMPGEVKLIKTGIKVAVPVGYELQVRPRSGISINTPLRISNTPGTIDSGYRGEVGIILENTSRNGENEYLITEKGNKQGVYKINKGDRIAQIVLNKYELIEFEKIEDVSTIGNNRNGGFGSSGVK